MSEQLDMFTTPVKTTVVNIKKSACDIYVGRGSIWGNPYSHLDESEAKVQVKTRKEAIAKYRLYFYSRPDLMEKAKKELSGKILGCFCLPKSCHASVIANFVNGCDKQPLDKF